MRVTSAAYLTLSAATFSAVAAAPGVQLRLQNSWSDAASSAVCNGARLLQDGYKHAYAQAGDALSAAYDVFEDAANDWMPLDQSEIDALVEESKTAVSQDAKWSPPTKSIYEYIKLDSRYTKLAKLVDYDYEIVKILDGASHGLTFFAPDDDAIPHPPKNRSHSVAPSLYESLDLSSIDSAQLFGDLLRHVEAASTTSEPDDDKKKEIFKKILHKVLLYHILPYDATVGSLALNSTVPTALDAFGGAYDGQPLRIKVERGLVPVPYTKLNGHIFLKAHQADVAATNGVVHGVTRPLLPPPSIFDIAFMIPKFYSTYTSAIQHSGLESAVGYKWVHESEATIQKFEGTPVVTAFVPSNGAFARLPTRLQFFLFSPFGARVLKKLLLFHVVPGYVVHTEWIHKESKDEALWNAVQGDEGEVALRFPTALEGYKLPVTIKKTLPKLPIPGVPAAFELTVLDQKVFKSDLVAFNGALHIIGKVLDPRRARKDAFQQGSFEAKEPADDDWADWEKWLPAWADEE